MNHISILIVDDDLNKITSIIKTIKEIYNDALSVSQASCVQEAIENLQKKDFHLLITDLQMPIKFDDVPNIEGGNSLVKSIYRARNKINVPMYIVGLTQFENLQNNFKGVWQVWYYDASNSDWKNNLRDLIFHISLVKSKITSNKIETLFVEGPTDKKIIYATLKFFFSQYLDKIYIDTINYGGGASWVERQIFIWAKSLTKNNDNYLKAIAIFDDDLAGNKSIINLRNHIDSNSAESKTFSIIKNSYKYSPILKDIRIKGISFPTAVEDLISVNCWKVAKANGWLEFRDKKYFEIDSKKLNISSIYINANLLAENHFSDDEVLITLYKVKDDFKVAFCNLACTTGENVLLSIKYLLDDVFIKLRI